MGLDITAYTNIAFQKSSDELEDGFDFGLFKLYSPHFLNQADGIKDGWYSGNEAIGFRAGSYGGYNEWRSILSKMALGLAPEDVWNDEGAQGPFVELIHFSDCEGFIGPKTSAKLYEDFVKYRNQAISVGDEWFLDRYDSWTAAFKAAGENNGVVKFH